MLSAFASAFRTPDLRKKLLFTLGIVALFRFGSSLPAPGIDQANVSYCAGVAAKYRAGKTLSVGENHANVFFSRDGVIGGDDEVRSPMHAARRKMAASVNGYNGGTYPLHQVAQFIRETIQYGFHKTPFE